MQSVRGAGHLEARARWRGRLHSILDEPKWMDTVWMPRNDGRVVFRTRFADYTGRWMHHCHVLLHEDHGMMQTVRSTDRAKDSLQRACARCLAGDELGERIDLRCASGESCARLLNGRLGASP